MPKPREKSPRKLQDNEPNHKDFTKRRTVEQGLRLADAAHEAVWRLYCEVFRFWRSCPVKRCRRYRRCDGEPARCLMRGLPSVPPKERTAAAKEVMAGGPRRIPPASHLEHIVRREPLAMLTKWPGGAGIRPRDSGGG